jgi:diguanylate cyclase (GGDEF)-like protein
MANNETTSFYMSPGMRFICRALTATLFVLLSQLSIADNDQLDIQTVNTGWSYHWGDVPYNGSWQMQTADWTPLDVFNDVPGRPKGTTILWIKLALPAGHWRDPYLFIDSVDLTIQAFEHEQLTYEFSHISLAGTSKFEGWPWHLVPVSSLDEPTEIYFRIFSDYAFIGLSGEVVIGEKSDLLQRVYKRGMAGMVFIVILFVAGILVTTLGIIKRERRIALSTGLLSFDLVIMMFAENELSQVVFNDPLMWRYLAAFSYFLVPFFLAIVVREWFTGVVKRIALLVCAITSVFILGVIFASYNFGVSFINAYSIFDGLFILLVLSLLVGCFFRRAPLGFQDGLVIFGILALFLSLLADMFSAYNFLFWISHAGQWGLVFFTLAMLTVYLAKDRDQQINLNLLMNSLEKQVEERTYELTESQKRLEQLAQEDFLTGLLNRRSFVQQSKRELANALRRHAPFALVLFDIDHFKSINDTYGHGVGDKVLEKIAAVTKRTSREGDLICRYGGEEFVILLPESDADATHTFVNRLHCALQDISLMANNGEKINITASIGVVTFENAPSNGTDNRIYPEVDKLLELMLSQADEAMYDVKNNGRNGIKERAF